MKSRGNNIRTLSVAVGSGVAPSSGVSPWRHRLGNPLDDHTALTGFEGANRKQTFDSPIASDNGRREQVPGSPSHSSMYP